MSDHLVLFDMDGTLTPARGQMGDEIAKALMELLWVAEVGVVSGSDYNYLQEQMPQVFEDMLLNRIIILPCNGTKVYKHKDKIDDYEEIYFNNMEEHLGAEVMAGIMAIIFDLQKCLVKEKGLLIPLTGNFLELRGSMINWCPIGRNANTDQREQFRELDQETGLRVRFLGRLNRRLKRIDSRVTAVLGGNTSFDIYPSGWDKTYVLKHFDDYEKIWFVGDRCEEFGNDAALYDAIKPTGFAYKTRDPAQTLEIIESIVRRIADEKSH